MEADDLSSNEFFIGLQRQRTIWDIVSGLSAPPNVDMVLEKSATNKQGKKRRRRKKETVSVEVDASVGFLVCVPHALSLRDAVTPSMIMSHILCTTSRPAAALDANADNQRGERAESTCSAPPKVVKSDTATRMTLDFDSVAATKSDESVDPESVGAFVTLNGKSVKITGSEITTGAGFKGSPRTVRILYTEELLSSRTAQKQPSNNAWEKEENERDADAAAGNTQKSSAGASSSDSNDGGGMDTISIVHIDRPFEGGIDVPFGGAENLDALQISRFISLLRVFPENELLFHSLGIFFRDVNALGDEWKAAAKKANCPHPFSTLENSIDAHVRAHINAAVVSLRKQDYLREINSASQLKHHMLQLEQVMESFVLSNIHDALFPHLVQNHQAEDRRLHRALDRLAHCSHTHLGARAEFQVPVDDAVRELLRLASCKTALQKLLCLKSVFAIINATVESNLHSHYLEIGSFQMTADDLVDQLIFVLIRAHEKGLRALNAHVAFIRQFHSRNVNTTVLGYNLANLEVAIEWAVRCASESACPAPDTIAMCSDESTPSSSSPPPSSLHGATRHLARRGVIMLGRKMGKLPPVFEEARPSSVLLPASKFGHVPLWSVAAGHKPFFAALDADGRLFMFGVGPNDMFGRRESVDVFGDDDDADGALYTPPMRLSQPHDGVRFKHIACGAKHVVACTIEGGVYTWGANGSGQLGTGRVLGSSLPRSVKLRPRIVAVACGASHSLALDAKGRAYSWGRGKCGRLGHGSINDVHAPKALELDRCEHRVVSIAAGWSHSLVVAACGTCFAFGCGKEGRLGLNSHSDELQARAITAFRKASAPIRIVSAAAGYAHSVFLSARGRVFCAGQNVWGQLGRTPHAHQDSCRVHEQANDEEPVLDTDTLTRVRMDGGAVSPPLPLIRTPVKRRSATADSASGLGNVAGKRRMTADALLRSLAQSIPSAEMTPKRPPVGRIVEDESADGADGDFAPVWQPGYVSLEPASVPFLSGKFVSSVAAGENHSSAVLSDGRVCLWGDGRNGQCGGQAPFPNVAAPHILPLKFEVAAAVCASAHTLLLLR